MTEAEKKQNQKLNTKENIFDPLLTLSEILNQDEAPDTDIIEGGVIVESGITFVSGAPKVGKTTLTTDLCFHLAFRDYWLGLRIKTKKVLYMYGEGGANKMIQRLKALGEQYSDCDNLDNFIFAYSSRLNLGDTDSLQVLLPKLASLQIEIMVVDPLSHFHSLDENSSRDMTQLMKNIRIIIDELNVSVIIIHHDTKQGGPLRGHSILAGEYDTLIQLKKVKAGQKSSGGKRITSFSELHDHWSLDITCRHGPSTEDLKLKLTGQEFSLLNNKQPEDN